MSNLARWVRDAARRDPDAPAVRQPGTVTTYGELDRLAARLATALHRLGVGRGDRVAIWLPKSRDTVAAMQAVLRLGAAYVPIDPFAPHGRVRDLLLDARVAACVTREAWAQATLDGTLADLPRLVIGEGPDAQWRELPEERWAEVAEAGNDELAYILYTSGSTGRPKGVCISHGNARAFVDWAGDELDARAADRFANHAAFHFDLSVLDLYTCFRAGASVYLIPERASLVPSQLVQIVREEAITVWYSVPSALILMLSAGLADQAGLALRAILFAGEPFPIAQLRQLREGFAAQRMLNLYGPTETNVCVAHELPSELDADATSIPIGTACSSDRVWAVTDTGAEAPVGERGELIVDGPTVMLGYWGQPPHRGPYATGDLVERLDEATFAYVGRRDAMVKVRGYRIEPAEVEAVLSTHPAVLEAGVAVTGRGPDARLIGVIAPRDATAVSILELKRHCAEALPREMLIDRLHAVPALPRTANGKLDRAALDRLCDDLVNR